MSESGTILKRMAESFVQKIDDGYHLRAGIVVDEGSKKTEWRIEIRPGRQAELIEGSLDGIEVKFRTSIDALSDLSTGKLGGHTAAGKSQRDDVARVDLPEDENEILWGGKPSAGLLDRMSEFIHFWTIGHPEIIQLGTTHSRFLHGANAIALYPWEKALLVWFQIEPGNTAWEPPCKTGLLVMEGSAVLSFDDHEYQISSGCFYYFVAKSEILIHNRSQHGCTLLFVGSRRG